MLFLALTTFLDSLATIRLGIGIFGPGRVPKRYDVVVVVVVVVGVGVVVTVFEKCLRVHSH